MASTEAREQPRPARRGSPWTGLGTVVAKETADHLSSARMRIIEALVFLTAIASAYAAIREIRDKIGESPFLFLRLLTFSKEPLPSFISLLGFLIPLVAIALAFDAINGEFNRRTLSRVLAQPIYRDALLLGKFLGALLSLTIGLVSLWLLVIGLGLLLLGLPPGGEEMVRMLGFLVATIAYGGGMAGARPAVLGAVPRAGDGGAGGARHLAVVLAVLVGDYARSSPASSPDRRKGCWARASPISIPSRSSTASRPTRFMPRPRSRCCQPGTRALGPVLISQLQGALLGAPLPVTQSFVLIWPQLTGLIAATILIFAIAYVVFQRQEIRA